MMRPLYEKARLSIEKVAAAQGYEYVLDSSPGGSVIMASGKDLMTDVKSDLGF
jgi:outer membrane protein